jgi:hypothetical protein
MSVAAAAGPASDTQAAARAVPTMTESFMRYDTYRLQMREVGIKVTVDRSGNYFKVDQRFHSDINEYQFALFIEPLR